MKRELLRLEDVFCSNELKHFRFAVYEREIIVFTSLLSSSIACVKNVLTGTVPIESGYVWFEGIPVPPSELSDHVSSGVFAVQKKLSLIPQMTVEDNFCLFQRKYHHSRLPDRKMSQQQVAMILHEMGMDISLSARVNELSRLQQRTLELIKTVFFGIKIILIEDVWTQFTPEEMDIFFRLVQVLREDCGMSFVFLTSRFDYVEKYFDRLIVMREGDNKTFYPGEYVQSKVYQYMTGASMEEGNESPPGPVVSTPDLKPILSLRNICSTNLAGLSLSAYPGIIYGIVDSHEHGQSDLLRIFSGDSDFSGEILLNEKPFSVKSRTEAVNRGLAMIRSDDGDPLYRNLTWPENLALMYRSGCVARGENAGRIFSGNTLRAIIAQQGEELEGLPTNMRLYQQKLTPNQLMKLTYLRWLYYNPYVLICDKPLDSNDILLRQTAKRFLRMIANHGSSVIVFTPHAKDIESYCDQVFILTDGRLKPMFSQEKINKQGDHYAGR